MRKDSNSPRRVRISPFDKLGLAMSTSRHVDGIWIGSLGRSTQELMRVESALSLIRQYSPLDHARVIRGLDRIWVTPALHGVGEYWRSINACILDERYLADPAVSIERIASTIVHETTHARIERYGIEYSQELRKKIEAICIRRQLAFVRRLPNSAELQRDTASYLERSQASPERYIDAQYRRDLGVPEWVERTIVIARPKIDRVKKVSPILAWAISAVFAIVFTIWIVISWIPKPKAWSKRKP
jgi:hypothetical protein